MLLSDVCRIGHVRVKEAKRLKLN